jgi:hypothetical protein
MAESSIIVVFDESISPRVCGAIEGFCSGDPPFTFKMMPRGTKDNEWLSGFFPSDPPHVVIAKDSVLKPRAQTLLWLKGGLTVVVVDGRFGNIPLEHLGAILLRWWPAISATIRGNPRHGAFVVPTRFVKRDRLPKWVRKPRKRRAQPIEKVKLAKTKIRPGQLDRRQGRLDGV